MYTEDIVTKDKNNSKLKIIPLGGLGEIGKNITAFETEEDIVIVDCGLAFPDDDMLGIDLVIPDMTYLAKNVNKIRAIVLTHGHEDHIGALPFVLKDIRVPVYGTKLTLALVERKLEEHGLNGKIHMQVVKCGQTFSFGTIKVEFINTNHSIADSCALALYTPAGTVVHTGDFKIDFTPIVGEPLNLSRFGELGRSGVLVLMADSTGVERKGYTMSERTVGEKFIEIMAETEGRIIIATFASNIHRIQQIIDAADMYGRKTAVVGRSMENVLELAIDLGYMNIAEGALIDISDIDKYPDDQIVIITTGSQGEAMSALTRMAAGEHRKVSIKEGDTVVVSASAIPGNEKLISKVINDLFRKGANVIYEALDEIHVSGHAKQEELKIIHNLVKPKYFLPVHGEYRHLIQHARLAEGMGMNPENIFILDNGDVLSFYDGKDKDSIKAVADDQVVAGSILVDGLGVGDVGNVVLKDRKILSQDGLIIIIFAYDFKTSTVLSGPDVISRGFVYVKESDDLIDSIKEITLKALKKTDSKKRVDWTAKKNQIRDDIRNYVFEKTKRKPMILPVAINLTSQQSIIGDILKSSPADLGEKSER